MSIRIVSFNMKHFKGRKSRVEHLVDYLRAPNVNADIIGIYEVTGKAVYACLSREMSSHIWVQSDHPDDGFKGGRESQKILVGIRRTYPAFFSLRSEFRTYNPYLRPGVFVTVKTPSDVDVSLLFLHLKSHSTAEGLGTRQKQFKSLLKLGKKVPNFIALGDFNTLGMDYPYVPDVEPEHELRWLDGRLNSRGLQRLKKTVSFTWSPDPDSRTYPRADIDHVIASKNLDFTQWRPGVHVRVDGPNEGTSDDKIRKWRDDYSDHSALYMELKL